MKIGQPNCNNLLMLINREGFNQLKLWKKKKDKGVNGPGWIKFGSRLILFYYFFRPTNPIRTNLGQKFCIQIQLE